MFRGEDWRILTCDICRNKTASRIKQGTYSDLGKLKSVKFSAMIGHTKDGEVYPTGTIVRIIKKGEFARIDHPFFQLDGRGFLHYLAVIEGRGDDLYALYHERIELECGGPNL